MMAIRLYLLHYRDFYVRVYFSGLRGWWSIFFFRWFWKKKIITNSYFILFFMFICQNVGNLKGFLLEYIDGLYLITLSSYSSTGEAPHHSNKILNKIKYLSIQLLIRGTYRGVTEGMTVQTEFPYLTSLFF